MKIKIQTNKLLQMSRWTIVFAGFVFLFLFGFPSDAAINKQINYQGKLTDSDGVSVADGNYDIVFKIYDASSGGNTLWTGNYTAANGNPVTTSRGIFSVMLGSGTGNSLDLDFSSDTYYLGVKVGSDLEMTPRKRIGAVPQAYNSSNVIGTGYINVQGAPTGSAVSGGTVYINPATASSGYTLLGVAVGGVQKMKLNDSGDLAIAGNLTGGTYNTATISGGTLTATAVNGVTTSNIIVSTGSYADPAWITSLAKSKIGLSNVENTALSTWAGSTNITTLGTIASGTWNGTTIAVANGGTGTTNGSITGTGALTFAAGGSNQNVNLTPSGTGSVSMINTVSNASNNLLYVVNRTNVSTSGTYNQQGLLIYNYVNPDGDQTANNTGYHRGLEAYSFVRENAGTLSEVTGSYVGFGTYGPAGADVSATITNLYGLRLVGQKRTSATHVNAYGLHISGVSGSTLAYDIYAEDAAAENYFAGNVGIGTSDPGSKLHIIASDYNAIQMANTATDAVNKGAIITGSRKTNANVPFSGFGAWDDGTTRFLYIGGGAWTRPDATRISFFTASAYNETNDQGVERLRIHPAGGISVGSSYVGTSVNDGNIIISGNIGIGTNNPGEMLHLLSSTSFKPVLKIENTNADANPSVLNFTKTSASAANNDELGQISFRGLDSTSVDTNFAYVLGKSSYITNGDESGQATFYALLDGTARNFIDLKGYNGTVGQGEIILNEDGQDIDFRVEGSGAANALFVQGSDGSVGIGTSGPGAKLNVVGGRSMFQVDNSGIIQSYRPGNALNAGNIHFLGDDSLGNSTDYTSIASYITSNTDGAESGGMYIFTRNSGTSDIRMTISSDGNLGLGQTTFGTSAAKVFAIGNGTAPASSPADAVQMYVADYAAGDARLYVRSETGNTLYFGNGAVSSTGSVTVNAGSGNNNVVLAPAGTGGVGVAITPQELFHVDKSTGAGMRLSRTANGTGSSTLGYIDFANATRNVELYANEDGAVDSGKFVIQTKPTGGSLTDRFSISSAGLAVFGSVSPSLSYGVEIARGGAGTSNALALYNVSDGDANGTQLGFYADNAAGAAKTLGVIRGVLTGSNTAEIQIDSRGLSNALVIANGGEVGVGISPNFKLHVAGNSDTDFVATTRGNVGVALSNATSGALNNIFLDLKTETNGEVLLGAVENAGNTAADFVLQQYSGSAYAENLRVTAVGGNFGLGQTTFGTNAAKVLGIANGTAPSTSPSDAVQIWSADRGGTAGKASLHIRTEDGTSHVFGDNSGIGTITPGAKLQVMGDVNVGGVGTQGTLRIYSSSASGTGAFGYFQADNTNLGRVNFVGGNGSAATQNTLAVSSNLIDYTDDTHYLGTGSNRWYALNVGTGGGSFAGSVSASSFSGSGASLTGLAESNITDGTILARVGSTETISGAWTFSAEPQLSGSGRHARKLQINAEYPGAVLSAFYGSGTDTSITGTMTSDTESSGNLLRNYYEWTSTQSSLNYYTVAVRVTLPSDFSDWDTNNAIVIDYKTTTGVNTDNALSVYVYNADDTPGTVVASSTSNASSSWGTITLNKAALVSGSAPELNTAGHSAVIYLRMGAKSSNVVRIGDVKLNYLSKW